MKKIITTILIIILCIATTVLFFINKNKDIKTKIDAGSIQQATPPSETYTNIIYGFSFIYPKDYSVNDVDGLIVVKDLQNKPLFQIQIQEVDEDIEVITVDRIKKDIPDMIVENPQDVVFGTSENQGRGVTFVSDNNSVKSREIWFVRGRILFQVSGSVMDDILLQKIFESWKFL